MRIKSLLGIAVASVAFAPSLQSIPAWADGPKSAYDNGGTDASLDPGEERMTADEENRARQQELSNAYHNGYVARAKEDAETYASLRDQLKHPPAQVQSHDAPPLPPGMPNDEAMQEPVPQPHAAQRALPAPPGYQTVAQQPRYAPPPTRYQPTPAYAQAPVIDNGPWEYQQPVYVQQAYAAPPPPAVQYVPVYTQEGVQEYPVQAVVQPVVAVASPMPYPVYRTGYWPPGFPRPYRDGPMIYQVWQ
ncbi:hypothetical protein [Trinickia mobilis]|uniref:hypothetical protein n=1 Tax=Trinickia mobilis TaxID=2816356 RepID=UPI001A8F234D|nr:hypothetical protein [Trinickia mobilis]